MSELERFTVYHPKEVTQILKELSKSKALLNVSFNQGQDQCLTNVIAVDYDKRAVYLDIGLDAGFNRRLLDSQHMIFSKDDGIRVRWTSNSISLVKLKDGEALKIALPKSVLRLQRREYYRSLTPVANPLMCSIPYRNPLDSRDDTMFEPVLIDASLGGLGMYISNPLPSVIGEGQLFEHCRLSIPDFGELQMTLKLRYVKEITLKNGALKYRIGFEFVDLSREAQKIIQRYVIHLEREALALASDR